MGLLDELYNDPNSLGLLSAGMGMMNAGGPSRMPVSFGQAMNDGLRSGMGAYQHAQHSNMEKQRFAQSQKMGGLQEQMLNMQLEGAKTTDARRKAFEQMLPQMPDDVKQAYLMAGPEKAFEMWNQNRLMSGFDNIMNPASAPAPRPYQNQTNPAQMRLDTPDQQNQLLADYEKLKKINPAEAEQLREGLVQQGVIQAPMQTQQPDWNRVAQMSARAQLGGIKGATGMMELAKMNKPDWKVQDIGGQLLPYNANSSANPLGNGPINKTMSPDSAASNQLGWANYGKPTYHDGALVSPNGEIVKTPMYAPPKGSPEATAQASSKVLPIITEAEKLLKDATGSYMGTARDAAARVVGVSTQGSQNAAKLKALEGALMMAQPRMEGPQSDKDVALYKQMAGQVGDSTIPSETRQAALDGIKAMHKKYAGALAVEQKPTNDTNNKTIVGTGTYGGKKVVKYSDGSVDYAD